MVWPAARLTDARSRGAPPLDSRRTLSPTPFRPSSPGPASHELSRLPAELLVALSRLPAELLVAARSRSPEVTAGRCDCAERRYERPVRHRIYEIPSPSGVT